MATLPRCDELREAACSSEWEDMFILYCRRAIIEYSRFAREINGLCDGLTVVIEEREIFIDKLMKLQILGREFEIRALEKNRFIEALKGNSDY
ncbi:hypothetical protein Tco_0503003 [Tanacetum coccineum]